MKLFSHNTGQKTVDLNHLTKFLVKKYDLDLLIVFGSYADNSLHGESDFDIGFLSKNRLSGSGLVRFIYDALILTGFNKVNAIDMYFPPRWKPHPTVLQYSIFQTGILLYESTPGLFEEKKNEISMHELFQGKNLETLIVKDKVQTIKSLLQKLEKYDEVETKVQIELVGKAPRPVDDVTPHEFCNDARTMLGLDAAHTVFKLNRFLLKKWGGCHPENNVESFLKLRKISSLGLDAELLEKLSHIGSLESELTLDYYRGPRIAVRGRISYMKDLLPAYLDAIESFVEKAAS